MKRNDLLIGIGTIAYSILFYKQLAGINFLVFNFLILLLFLLREPALVKSPRWLLIAVATMFTAFCIVGIGSWLSVISNVVMLILLCAYSMSPKSSVILNFFFSFYSIAGSLIFIILRMVDPAFRQKKEGAEQETNGKGFTWKKFLTFFLPFVLILIFFFIYRSANPLFAKYTDELNLDFISLWWILFTLGGFLIVSGIFYQYRIKAIDNWELNKPKYLVFSENQKILKWINERNAALFLFGMLDLMLLFINGTDINFLYLGAKLPEGINHSDFVHNGVGMLIFSIVIAVSLILFFFRGNMNFEKQSTAVKVVVYLWIGLNIFMVISTILRNNMYVEEFNLTYKRLGVYIYLTLTIVGLITTFIKIFNKRTNWFLVRSNSLAGILLMVILSAMDLDLMISNFNIKHAKNISSLDKSYLISLSETNLPELYELRNKDSFNSNAPHHYTRFYRVMDFEGNNYGENKKDLDKKLLAYLSETEGKDWRSWNMRRDRIYKALEKLNADGTISDLDFTNERIQNLSSLKLLNKLKSLELANTYYYYWKDLEVFPALEKLNVRNNGIQSLDSFPALKNLKELRLTGNDLADYSALSKFPALETFEFTNAKGEGLKKFPSMEKLSSIDLSYGNFAQLDFLKNQNNLTNLNFTGGNCEKGLPLMKNLKVLNLSAARGNTNTNLKKTLMSVPKLEELYLYSCELSNLSNLYYQNPDKTFSPNFPELKILELQFNQIAFAENVYLFTKLEELNLSNNKLLYIPNLQTLTQLKVLRLGGNNFSDLSPLEKNSAIEILDISGNAYIKDFSVLKNLNNLQELNLSQTLFTNLNYLQGMKNLKSLNLQGTYIDTLNGIEKMPLLENLSVQKIRLADFVYLKQLRQLKSLTVTEIHPDIKEKLEKQFPGTKLVCEQISETYHR